jgi:FkbM family methyltransferase
MKARGGMLADRRQYVLPNGVAIVHRNKSETDFVYREIFEDHCYSRHGIALRTGDCVFDVGANIGLFSLYLSRLPFTVDVFAFEPVPPIYQLLEENRTLCGMHNVRTFSHGLSSKAETATFTYYSGNSIMSGRYADSDADGDIVKAYLRHQLTAAGGFTAPSETLVDAVAKNALRGERFECALRTLSDVIAKHSLQRIDLLKLDVEKSELDILRGIADKDWPKIMQVVVEVYDSAGQRAVVERLLKKHGFSVVVVQDDCLRGSPVHMVYATRAG